VFEFQAFQTIFHPKLHDQGEKRLRKREREREREREKGERGERGENRVWGKRQAKRKRESARKSQQWQRRIVGDLPDIPFRNAAGIRVSTPAWLCREYCLSRHP
jgi:hypothetical protein